MWFSRSSALSSLVAVAALAFSSTHASPRPLSTTASTTATMEGPGAGNSGLLIHVIRTEDLIADKLKSKPLLLEKTSHLIIKVELGNDSVAVNGHSLPVLGSKEKDHNGKDVPLEMTVTLKEVQMLKMPKDSPLVPLGLSSPELLKISDKYMSEGLVGAVLSVRQEPLSVEAMRSDGTEVDAKAYKVTISIKILEVEGMALEQTTLPAVDLLHLIVHPDPENPAKVATMTTIAPEEFSSEPEQIDPVAEAAEALRSAMPSELPDFPDFGDFPSLSGLPNPSDLLGAALAATSASLNSALSAMSDTARELASHAGRVLEGTTHQRKPCPGHKHRLGHGVPAPSSAESNAAPAIKDYAMQDNQGSSPVDDHHEGHHHGSVFSRPLACLIKMATKSLFLVLLVTLPIFVALGFSTLRRKLQQRRLERADYKVTSMTEDRTETEKLLVDEDVEKV